MAKLTFNAILVICTGNICRSPIGERLLRRLLPAARVDSAGTCGLEGSTADSQATEIAAERGYVDKVIYPHETRAQVIKVLRLLRTKRMQLPPKKHGNIPL